MRIVIDTNVWISYLIQLGRNENSKVVDAVDTAMSADALLFTESTYEELTVTFEKPKFRRHFSRETSTTLLQILRNIGEFRSITTVVTIARDPDDNKFLALALDGDADFIITGDQDLLSLNNWIADPQVSALLSAFTILSPAEFIDRFAGG